MKTFEEYLQQIHAEQYTGTDDDMPDSFETWITDLDLSEIIAHADRAVIEAYKKG